MKVENRRKNEIWNITKCDISRVILTAKNDCRLKTGIKPVKKALKSPQCGDFLQVLVLCRRRRFVRHRKKKVSVCLENMGFSTDVGTGIKGVFGR